MTFLTMISFICKPGSVTPRLTLIQTTLPVRCPTCLLPEATVYQYKSSKVLKVFFVPILTFGSKSIWQCKNCGWTSDKSPDDETIRRSEIDELTHQRSPLPTWGLSRCRKCGKESNFSGRRKFCPYCGDEPKGR